MTDFRLFGIEDAVAAASAALSRAWARPVGIDAVRSLGGPARRNLVLRARTTMGGTAPRGIVVKATRAASYDPDAENAYAQSGFVKEWAASTFLARHAAAQTVAPALLASDLPRGVLVYDDLGDSAPSLVEPLLHGNAREAERALTAYAAALASLHRATIDCRPRHAAILREGFPRTAIPPPAQRWRGDVDRSLAAVLGAAPPADDVEHVASRLQRPGGWQVLIHGDPCPDNVLVSPDGRTHLIDFEFARPGHALLDAAYWRMAFPTCWCAGTVPEAVAQRVEQAYRAALADTVPEAADDDAFRHESALIDSAWLLGNLSWLLEGALAEDGTWGRATNRARILTYLQTAIRSAEQADILPRIRAWAASLHGRLRDCWPQTSPLTHFPAFTRPETVHDDRG